MKKKYIVTIEESCSQEFEVFAEDFDEAFSIAENKYNNGEFVLEPGNITTKQMAIENDEDGTTEWIEF